MDAEDMITSIWGDSSTPSSPRVSASPMECPPSPSKPQSPSKSHPPPPAEKPQGPSPSSSTPYPFIPEVHVTEGSAVVAKQECRLGEGQLPPQGYTLLLPQGGSPGGEAALLIRNGTRFSEIDLKTGLYAAAATISLEKTLTVCSLYLPPNSQVSKLSLAELFEQLPKPFLVLGDFNAHSPVWGDSCRDGRGRMLEEFTAENDLIILNSGEQLLFIWLIIRPRRLILQWLHPPLPPNVPGLPTMICAAAITSLYF
ncbi:RNA-directed DNA polymerase from mobile element jockey [Plakobranchus ocellatus]|uniref:RNA-directed DNA polymerase from mobile element jockey n=1 Tax=Plakobranchus ocellatus TaxID=259542 RepID=A0AAV3Z3S5_9GAST|nr:RNA-directed DNA polymerase from mobile element jockey [Plakobranchus ocellatus]